VPQFESAARMAASCIAPIEQLPVVVGHVALPEPEPPSVSVWVVLTSNALTVYESASRRSRLAVFPLRRMTSVEPLSGGLGVTVRFHFSLPPSARPPLLPLPFETATVLSYTTFYFGIEKAARWLQALRQASYPGLAKDALSSSAADAAAIGGVVAPGVMGPLMGPRPCGPTGVATAGATPTGGRLPVSSAMPPRLLVPNVPLAPGLGPVPPGPSVGISAPIVALLGAADPVPVTIPAVPSSVAAVSWTASASMPLVAPPASLPLVSPAVPRVRSAETLPRLPMASMAAVTPWVAPIPWVAPVGQSEFGVEDDDEDEANPVVAAIAAVAIETVAAVVPDIID